jgi:hypothetical protein
MLLMRLGIGAELDDSMFSKGQMLASPYISWGIFLGSSVLVLESVQPKYSVLHQMDKGNPRQVLEQQHAICSARPVLHSADISLYFRIMFLGSKRVQVWIPLPEWFELARIGLT